MALHVATLLFPINLKARPLNLNYKHMRTKMDNNNKNVKANWFVNITIYRFKSGN